MIAPRAKVAALQRSIASTVKQRILTFDLNMAGLAGIFRNGRLFRGAYRPASEAGLARYDWFTRVTSLISGPLHL